MSPEQPKTAGSRTEPPGNMILKFGQASARSSPSFGRRAIAGHAPGEGPFHRLAAWGQSQLSLYLNWPLVFSVLALYILISLVANGSAGRLNNPWTWLSTFITPFNHVLAITLVAPMPWMLGRSRSRLWTFLRGLLLSLVACEICGVSIVVLDAWFMRKAGIPPGNYSALLVVYAGIMAPGMMVLGGLMAARAQAVEETESIREEAMVAKTRLLQSQLHPHVLFNALNGLAELIHKDPPAAERSVGHLADLLRRILRASEQATFPLGEERALVENYLHLEGMRLGPRLEVHWEWDPTLNGLPVAPLLIQPLVENAIKHGIAPCPGGGALIIRASSQENDLLLEVWNTGTVLARGQGGGIGLKNLEARVVLVYGPTARFTIFSEGDWTKATIHLPGALIGWFHEDPERPRCG